jgi:hypothetical protein
MNDESEQPAEELEAHEESMPSPDDAAALAHYQQLEAQLRTGANWFFWIAALSVVNSFILLAEGDRSFVIGLGITQFVNAIAIAIGQNNPEIATVLKVVAVVVTFIAAAVVAAFGFGARRRLTWVFILGMILYAMDGMLYLLMGPDLKSFGFHIFALWCISRGLSACRQLNGMDAAPAVATAD